MQYIEGCISESYRKKQKNKTEIVDISCASTKCSTSFQFLSLPPYRRTGNEVERPVEQLVDPGNEVTKSSSSVRQLKQLQSLRFEVGEGREHRIVLLRALSICQNWPARPVSSGKRNVPI